MISAAPMPKKKEVDEDLPRKPAYFWWLLANTLALSGADHGMPLP